MLYLLYLIFAKSNNFANEFGVLVLWFFNSLHFIIIIIIITLIHKLVDRLKFAIFVRRVRSKRIFDTYSHTYASTNYSEHVKIAQKTPRKIYFYLFLFLTHTFFGVFENNIQFLFPDTVTLFHPWWMTICSPEWFRWPSRYFPEFSRYFRYTVPVFSPVFFPEFSRYFWYTVLTYLEGHWNNSRFCENLNI